MLGATQWVALANANPPAPSPTHQGRGALLAGLELDPGLAMLMQSLRIILLEPRLYLCGDNRPPTRNPIVAPATLLSATLLSRAR